MRLILVSNIQMTFESVETQFWVTKIVRQQIPNRHVCRQQQGADDRNSSIHSDQHPLSGRLQMLATSNVCY